MQRIPEEITLLRGRLWEYCDCIAGGFDKRPWGTPVVETTRSQGFTVITITVPVRFWFTCKKTGPEGRCIAILAPLIVKTDFDKPLLAARHESRGWWGGICSGKPTVNKWSLKYIVALRGEHPTFLGTFQLRFDLQNCLGVDVWDMTLVIRDGKLDEDASDYDGDGTPNKDEGPGLEWDPGR